MADNNDKPASTGGSDTKPPKEDSRLTQIVQRDAGGNKIEKK